MGMFGRKRFEITQHDESDCAAACISSVCAYYGRYLPLVQVRDLCGTTDNGTNMQGVVDGARRLGLEAVAMKASVKRWSILSSLDHPAVLHLEKPGGRLHFVVLYKWKEDRAEVMDPSQGKMVSVFKDAFLEEWTGYLVLLSPSSSFVREDRTVPVVRRFMDVLSFCRGELLLAFAGAVVYILVGLSTSVFIQQLVDAAIPRHDMNLLAVFGIAMGVMAVASFLVGYVRIVITVRAGLETDNRLVSAYLGKILSLPLCFFSSRSTGELNSRIKDVYRIRNFLTVRLMIVCICVLTLAASFVLMFTYCWKMALVVAVYLPVYAFLFKITGVVGRKLNRKVIESSAAFDSDSVEILAGVRTVKYYGWENHYLGKLERKYSKYLTDSWKCGRYLACSAVSSDGIARLLTYAVLVAGTLMVFNGELSAGELVSFYSITSFFTSPVNSLIESNNEIAQANVAAGRLFEIMDMDSEEMDAGSEAPLDSEDNLYVENLTFSYPGGVSLFSNFSAEFPRGQVTAVSGSNGSGKSTLAMLLMRGCLPVGGAVRLGKINIEEYNIRSWRRCVSFVPQKAELFNGTVLENIAPDEKEPDVRMIASLCVEVGLDDALNRWPDGIMTSVGEGGCRLSGGERQKVAMVRSLYRNSPILVFDEATASVDDDGRDRFLEIVKRMSRNGKIIIMITHDEACLTAADRIVVVNQN